MFMEFIDTRTQYYLSNIDWDIYDGAELKDKINEIKKHFYDSLNENDPLIKLDIVLSGYYILVEIVEEYRKEKCEKMLDDDFLEIFEPEKKRQKY